MKALNIIFTLNDKKIEVHHKMLTTILDYTPDIKENKQIFEDILSINNWRAISTIAHYDNLSNKAVKKLLKSDRHGIHTNLLRNKTIRQRLTHKQIINIINLNNPIHCEEIASNLSDFKKANKKKLAKILSQHTDPYVKYKLLLCNHKKLSIKVLKRLCKDEDPAVVSEACRYINLRK